MGKSKIEWTEHTWNPVRGCTRIAEGCRNCYAERMAARFCGDPMHPQTGTPQRRKRFPFSGFVVTTAYGPRWTGRVELIPEMLDIPLRRRKPTTYFVNSMSDLFHEALPDEAIDKVFGVMALCPQHRFIVLTKRGARMREYFQYEQRFAQIEGACDALVGRKEAPAIAYPDHRSFPNLVLGVSSSTQADADDQIPHLLATPAACRMVSLEPLIEDIHTERWLRVAGFPGHCYDIDGQWWHEPGSCAYCSPRLDWVIVGGESGPGARACETDDIRSLLRQCREAGVPCFVKQLGAHIRGDWREFPLIDWTITDGAGFGLGSKGGDPSEWPEDLRVRELPALLAE